MNALFYDEKLQDRLSGGEKFYINSKFADILFCSHGTLIKAAGKLSGGKISG